jgi:hypothetical protein
VCKASVCGRQGSLQRFLRRQYNDACGMRDLRTNVAEGLMPPADCCAVLEKCADQCLGARLASRQEGQLALWICLEESDYSKALECRGQEG